MNLENWHVKINILKVTWQSDIFKKRQLIIIIFQGDNI